MYKTLDLNKIDDRRKCPLYETANFVITNVMKGERQTTKDNFRISIFQRKSVKEMVDRFLFNQ